MEDAEEAICCRASGGAIPEEDPLLLVPLQGKDWHRWQPEEKEGHIGEGRKDKREEKEERLLKGGCP